MLSSRRLLFYSIIFLFVCKISAKSSELLNCRSYSLNYQPSFAETNKNITVNQQNFSNKYFHQNSRVSASELGFFYGFLGTSAGISSLAATNYVLDFKFPLEAPLVCLISTIGAASALVGLQYFESDFFSYSNKQFLQKWFKDSWKLSLGVAVGAIGSFYAISMLLPLTGSLLISSAVCFLAAQLSYLNRENIFYGLKKASNIVSSKNKGSGLRTGLLVDLGLISSRAFC